MKKVIVFGATGETGVYVVEWLKNNLGKEYEIFAVGRRRTDYFETIGVNYYIVDMQNEEDFAKLPSEEVFAIVELAGLLPARMRGYKPKKYIVISGLHVLYLPQLRDEIDLKIYMDTDSKLQKYWKMLRSFHLKNA